MRVALVTLHTSPLETPGTQDAGGMNVVVFELALALASIGHSVTLISAQHPTPLPAHSVPEGISLRSLNVPGERPRAKSELPDSFTLFAERLAPTLNDFDIVHSHYWLSSAVVQQAIALRTQHGQRNPAHVSSLHTIGAEKASIGASVESPLRVDTERELAHTVPMVASSRAEAASLSEWYGVDAQTVRVIAPGVDTALFAPQADVRADNPLQFAVVGRVQPFKGQDFALEVFAVACDLLAQSQPAREAQLVIAGDNTPGDERYVELLRDRAHAPGVEGRVQFVGALDRSQTAALLAASSITIIPSLSETFGLVALESAACATPVLAGAVGGLNDSVATGVSGVLMQSRDAQLWAETLVALVTDHTKLSRLRVTALEFARAHSWSNTAQLLVEFYERVMSAQR